MYLARLCSFPEILEHGVPFATGNFWKCEVEFWLNGERPKIKLFYYFKIEIALMRDDVTRFGANFKSRLGGDEIRRNILTL